MTELLLFDFSQKLAITIKFGLFDFTFFLEVTVFLYFSILLHISLIPKFDTLPNLTNFATLDHSRLKALKNSRMILNSGKYETSLCTTSALFKSCEWESFMASAEAVGGRVFISFLI